ncbi:F0F1 ATP synthase subunit gamma [Mycoplasmopsis felis]|nr:F0F1 ATP synthase subunit gamma [Mycoplasmopsis felis]MCU9939219.1 F0F1 ATP synthase subunit gamma [Mycoplasmopsis felis]WAM00594.1 F0F1 ATP synthase subunit gamma [Mycoplasmopsis felis]
MKLLRWTLEYYTDKKISKINLIYTEFINNLTQTPISLQLFPINVNSYSKTQNQTDSIEFEPNAETVLLETIPCLFLVWFIVYLLIQKFLK